MYILWKIRRSWIFGTKKIRGSNVEVIIKLNSDLDSLRFKDSGLENKKKIFNFVRKKIKKGEILEFKYPGSRDSISVIARKGREEKVFYIDV